MQEWQKWLPALWGYHKHYGFKITVSSNVLKAVHRSGRLVHYISHGNNVGLLCNSMNATCRVDFKHLGV